MSAFSDAWIGCMRGNGFPVIDAEAVGDALEFVDSIHSAWEKAGGDEKVTIGARLAAGAFVGADKATLVVLGEAAKAVFLAYVGACIACLGSVAIDDLRNLFAQGKVSDFVVAQLQDDGINLAVA
jgi:hypothetical protein